MDILLNVVLPLSLAFIMFSLGLGLRVADFTSIFSYPKAFAVGFVNQMILLPLVGFAVAIAFGLAPAIAVGMVILALSPGGVTSNVLAKLAGGNVALSISLTAVVTLVSVITLPIILGFAMTFFQGENAPEFSILQLSLTMFLITVVPVVLGMILTKLAPNLVAASAKFISTLAVILFAVIVVAAIAANWELLVSNLGTLAVAIVVFNLILLAMGLITARVSGLSGADATTIALETGVQNGTVSIAVAGLVVAGATGLPEQALPGALYGISMYMLGVPFALWRRASAR